MLHSKTYSPMNINVSIASITVSDEQLTMKFLAQTPSVDAGFGEMVSSSLTYYSRTSKTPKTLAFKVGDKLSINLDMLDVVEKPFLIPASDTEPAKTVQLKWLYAKK